MLNRYKQKRDFTITSEPSGKLKRSKGSLAFVVQKHHASHLHYDFRLEAGGVLLSWAVPKGPSNDPSVKRLAVLVEDHPFDYKDFEGVIPKGQYGAGRVIKWDSGTYFPVDGSSGPIDRKTAEKLIRSGIKKGKLTFVLRGTKLRGQWTLVRTKGNEKQWLLIKHKDDFSSSKAIKESVAISSKDNPQPMLASQSSISISGPEWIYEPKLDGVRAIGKIKNHQVTLTSRNGLLLNHRFPELIESLSKNGDLTIDGEIVALDKRGRPSFQLLQQIASKGKGKVQILYYVFDILSKDGRSLTSEVLSKRKKVLTASLKKDRHVKLVTSLKCTAKQAFSACVKLGMEGIVAKRADSTYETGRRSPNWIKVKSKQTVDLVIGGYTDGTGRRSNHFGALLLGYFDKKGQFQYAGKVGTGFDEEKLKWLKKFLRSLKSKESPFAHPIKGAQDTHWLIPHLVAEIKFAEWTDDKILRAPVFLRLRDDKTPEEAGP